MLGDNDDPSGFNPVVDPLIQRQWGLLGPHWRVPATGLVWECLLLAVLEQKVTGIESRRAWYRLCQDHGEPAPGPAPEGMRVAPGAAAVASIPSWWWRGAGVDATRAGTLQRLARQGIAPHITGTDPANVIRRLARVPGVGPWTIAEVACRALGDADAVSVGDYHLANLVGFALAGRNRSTDEEMLTLLQPYAAHRYRAVRMIELSGVTPPRFGPRRTLPTHL
jgi:3-methyladenine DNA glycosylase/8-oxoguanine DNA glycosylase